MGPRLSLGVPLVSWAEGWPCSWLFVQQYPEGIRKYDYDPSFAIRGLHYDIQKSLLMKIDAFHYVQLGTAYRGLQPVPDDEVIDLYGGTQHIPLYQMSGFYGKVPTQPAVAQGSPD